MRAHLSMFETDPAAIARGLSTAQVAYLRARSSGVDAPSPGGTWCGTLTADREVTERGRQVLAVLAGGAR